MQEIILTVAAIDSDESIKAQAQYVCDGEDDQVEIQLAINSLPISGGTVILADGTFVISEGITTCDNLTMHSIGKIKLADEGVAQYYMIQSYHKNVSLINPHLDGDRDNNTIYSRVGYQAGIYFKNGSQNNIIVGGVLENMPQMGIIARSHDLKITGTKISDCGEHGIYASGREDCAEAEDILLDNIQVHYPGRNGYGYGFKMRSVRNGDIRNGYVIFTGEEDYSTIGVVYSNGSQGGIAEAQVMNATYGCQIVSKDGNTPNRGISLSLDLVNCKYFGALPSHSGDATNCRISDSTMDSGYLHPNGFGTHAVIEDFIGNICYAPIGHDVDYTLRRCIFVGQSNWILDLRDGHDVVIDKCVFENTNQEKQVAHMQGIKGSLILQDCIFKGGNNYSLLFDPASGPTETTIITGSTFNLPSNGETNNASLVISKDPVGSIYLNNNVVVGERWQGHDRNNVIEFDNTFSLP